MVACPLAPCWSSRTRRERKEMTAAHHSQQTGSTEQLAVLGRALHAPDHLSFHGANTQPLIQTHNTTGKRETGGRYQRETRKNTPQRRKRGCSDPDDAAFEFFGLHLLDEECRLFLLLVHFLGTGQGSHQELRETQRRKECHERQDRARE